MQSSLLGRQLNKVSLSSLFHFMLMQSAATTHAANAVPLILQIRM